MDWIEKTKVKISENLSEKIVSYYENLRRNPDAAEIRFKKYHPHLFSIIYEFDIFFEGEWYQRIFAKQHRSDKNLPLEESVLNRQAIDLALKEYEFHREAYKIFSGKDPDLQVVRPLDYQKEINTLYIEKAPGIELGRWLSKNDFGKDPRLLKQATDYISRAAAMAKLLHAGFDGIPPGRIESGNEFLKIQSQILNIRRRELELNYLDLLESKLQKTIKLFDGVEFQKTKIHGDFKLQHIFVKENQLTLIDFGNDLDTDTASIDVAAFYVELMSLSFASFHSRFRKYNQELISVFIKEYFEGQEPDGLFYIKVIYYLLKKWNRRVKRFSHNRLLNKIEKKLDSIKLTGFLHHQYTNPWFIQQIENHLSKLESASKQINAQNPIH